MKLFIKKKHRPLAFPIAIALAGVTIMTFVSNVKLSKILYEKPTEIVVANTSTTSTNIYWKNNEGVYSKVSYREKDSNLPYSTVIGTSIYKNMKGNNYVYEAKVEGLKPNTEYIFQISSTKKVWRDEALAFKTKNVDEKIILPEIRAGSSNEGAFLLFEQDKGNTMIYTENHGTWTLDYTGDELVVSEYAQYIPSGILTERLRTGLRKFSSPIYAADGANCKTNITKKDNQYYPKIDGVLDVLDRLIGGCKGHYGNECYNDVYCRSIEQGVNPALPITLWVHESAGSMYAKYSDVEDFGIHGGGIPNRNFSAQLNHLLNVQMSPDYISGYCTDQGLTNEERWATKYARGYCNPTNIVAGKAYITEIRNYYSWLKGQNFPSWPWSVTANANACDRSKEVTNQVYRDCEGNPSGTNPDPDPDAGKTVLIITDEDKKCEDTKGCVCYWDNKKVRKEAKNTQVCKVDKTVVDDEDLGKTIIEVTDQDEYCQDTKGCVCYWDNKKIRKEAKNHQTCTKEQGVIDTVEVCCIQNDVLRVVQPYSCDGSIIDDIPLESCDISPFTYQFTKGINFVKAYRVFDSELEVMNTAHGLIEASDRRIITIASFNQGAWEQIVDYRNDKIFGVDFLLEPGVIYLMITTEAFKIDSSGYTINPQEIDLEKLSGWNLIPTSIFENKVGNAYEMFEDEEFELIRQIALWNKSVSMFEYTIKGRDNSVHGNDVTLTKQDSIFIKIGNNL